MFAELCRLCERPAADGGHRAAELDKDKLAEWCLNFLGTTLAEEIDDQDLFCYFCVWDARFHHNNNAGNYKDDNDMCWWPDQDGDKNAQELYKNYVAGKVQQCWVSLKKLPRHEKIASVAARKVESTLYKNCCYCNKQFTNLISHIKTIHADFAIRCNYHSMCSKYFETVEGRDAHVNEFHLKPKIEILSDCIYCAKRGFKEQALRKHVKSKHRDVAIRCSYQKCALYFKTLADLDSHFEAKHKKTEKGKKFECSHCDYKAKSRENIEHHEAKTHQVQRIIKCLKCAKTFSSRIDLKLHLNRTHNFRKCPVCILRIPISNYYQHFTKRSCRSCKVGFDCTELLRKHEKNCKLKCELCLESFSHKCYLKYHMNMKHLVQNVKSTKSTVSLNCQKLNRSKPIPKKFKCAHCSKELSSKYSIKSHLANAHNLLEKKRCCNQCSAKFYDAKVLKCHIRGVHSNEKAKCKICNKEMKLSCLRMHMINIHCAL